MRGGVPAELALVAAATDHGAVGIEEKGAHRHVARVEAGTRLGQRLGHPRVEIGHRRLLRCQVD